MFMSQSEKGELLGELTGCTLMYLVPRNPHHPGSQGSFLLVKHICEGVKKHHKHITISLDTQNIHHKVLGYFC